MKQNKQVNKEYRSYRETKDKIHCQIAQYTQIVIQLIVEARYIFIDVCINDPEEATARERWLSQVG